MIFRTQATAFAALAALLAALSAAAQLPRPVQVERALAHVQAREYDAALMIFRELVRKNPRDYEARNWVARLESWKENYPAAEQLYRAVLAEQPKNLEAELGLADVIAWQGRHREALERLRALYEREPTDLAVLLRLGKFSRWVGDRQAALRYYREALAVDLTNQEAQEAIALLTAQTNYRLEAGYFLEDFNFASSTNGSYLELLYTDNHRTTLLGRFGFQRKFEENTTRFSLGLTRRFRKRTYLHGEASFAPTGRVLANQEYEVELNRGLHPSFSAGLGYRFLNFRAANVHVLMPTVSWDPRRNLHLFVRYMPSRTVFGAAPGSVWNHSGWARLTWDINRTWSPYLIVAVGSENFSGISAEQLGRFAAQTYGAGTTVQLTARQGLRVGYFFQNRTRGQSEHNLAVSFFLRF